MKRRAFLGFLGGAAVAGPTAAKSAAEMTMADLRAPGVSLNSVMGDAPKSIGECDRDPVSVKEYAQSSLKKLLGKSARRIAFEKRTRWIDGLEPDVAGLRSVSLQHKIKMSRERAYDRAERIDEDTLRGRIAGWLE